MIRAPPKGAPDAGLTISNLAQSLIISNVTIQGFAVGIQLLGLSCAACYIKLQNVTLEGTNGTAGVSAIPSPGFPFEPSLIVEATLVRGYDIGLQLRTGGTVGVVNSAVAQGRTGMSLRGQEINVTNSSVENFTEDGLALTIDGGATASRLTIKNVGSGIFAHGGSLHVVDSVIQDNRAAVVAAGTSLVVETSRILANGGPTQGEGGFRGGLLADGEVVIRNSTLSGNVPLAVSALGPTADARVNFWGDPLGPRIAVTGAVAIGAGDGDAVDGNTMFYPFLDQPPSVA